MITVRLILQTGDRECHLSEKVKQYDQKKITKIIARMAESAARAVGIKEDHEHDDD